MRPPVLRALSGDRPSRRFPRQLGPSHTRHLATTLQGQHRYAQEWTERISQLTCRAPRFAELSIGEHSPSADFPALDDGIGERVDGHHAPANSPVEHSPTVSHGSYAPSPVAAPPPRRLRAEPPKSSTASAGELSSPAKHTRTARGASAWCEGLRFARPNAAHRSIRTPKAERLCRRSAPQISRRCIRRNNRCCALAVRNIGPHAAVPPRRLGQLTSLCCGQLAVMPDRHPHAPSATATELILQEEGLGPGRGHPNTEARQIIIKHDHVALARRAGKGVDFALAQLHRSIPREHQERHRPPVVFHDGKPPNTRKSENTCMWNTKNT